MRVVLDTNVLNSVLLWRKQLAPIFDLIETNKITICFSPDTIDEIKRVFAYPKIATQASKFGLDTASMLNQLLETSVIVQPHKAIVLPPLKKDPSDRMFIACAIVAHASCIVTGDGVLLALQSYEKIVMVTPKQLIDLVRKS